MASYHRVCCCLAGNCPHITDGLSTVILSVVGILPVPSAVSCPHISSGRAVFDGATGPLWFPSSNTGYLIPFVSSTGEPDSGFGECLYSRQDLSGYTSGQLLAGDEAACSGCNPIGTIPNYVGAIGPTVRLIHNIQLYASGWAMQAVMSVPRGWICCAGTTCQRVVGYFIHQAIFGTPGAPPFDIDDFIGGQVYSDGKLEIQRLP